MEFTVLSVLELQPQSPTAAILKFGIVVCAYITSILLRLIRTRNEKIVIMVQYPACMFIIHYV